MNGKRFKAALLSVRTLLMILGWLLLLAAMWFFSGPVESEQAACRFDAPDDWGHHSEKPRLCWEDEAGDRMPLDMLCSKEKLQRLI